MAGMTLGEALDVLDDARDREAPLSQRDAQVLADGLREQLADLVDWTVAVAIALAEVDEAGELMAGADSLERCGAHTLWFEAVGRARELVEAAT